MKSRTLRAASTAAALAIGSGALAAGHALAEPASPAPRAHAVQDRGSGWTPYRQQDIEYAAGARCEFAVRGTVVRDREEFKDVAHWPGGEVRTQLWRGALVIRWTNLDSGESVRRDQSARAVVEYREDGSMEQMTSLHGAFGVGLAAGDSPGRGVYVVDGRWSSVVIDEAGHRTLTLGPGGTAEDLCRTLG